MKINTSDLFAPITSGMNIISVVPGDQSIKFNGEDLPAVVPVLALRNAIIFPGTVYPITIGREKSMRLIEQVQNDNTFIGTVPQINVEDEDPKRTEDFSEYGTLAKVIKTFELPDGSITAVIQGFNRFHLDNIVSTEPYLEGSVTYAEETLPNPSDDNIPVIMEAIKEKASTIIKSASLSPKDVVKSLNEIDDFHFLVNFIATTVELDSIADKI